jgi:peptide-methionine (S)-S-oxide reductase
MSATRNRLLLALTLFAVHAALAISVAAAPRRAAQPATQHARATFAGGCFWCMEAVFDGLPGVVSATSGYVGGSLPNPNYKQVSAGGTGHAEAVEVVFDPRRISYAQLLELFWKNVDPLTANRQFCDEGDQYRAAIFYHDAEQKRLADATKAAIERSRRFTQPIVTQIVPVSRFYRAEEYHQDYHLKNPVRYKYYKYQCGRAQRLKALWGK